MLNLVAAFGFEVEDQPEVAEEHNARQNREGREGALFRSALNRFERVLVLRWKGSDAGLIDLVIRHAIAVRFLGRDGAVDHRSLRSDVGVHAFVDQRAEKRTTE